MRMTRQQIIASSVTLTHASQIRESLSDHKHHIDDKKEALMDTIPHIPMLLMLTPTERTLMIELVLTQELALHKSAALQTESDMQWGDRMKALCVKVRECLDHSSSILTDKV